MVDCKSKVPVFKGSELARLIHGCTGKCGSEED